MGEGRIETLDMERKLDYLRLYGCEPLSYLTTQPGFVEFHMPDMGYASFARFFGANLVLGDPVCDKAQWPQFVEAMLRQVKKPTFIQISQPFALLLGERFGYAINAFGDETALPLTSFSLRGNKKNNLRYAIRQGKKIARVEELSMEELRHQYGIVKTDLERVLADWMTTRTARHQLKFLVRPAVFEDEPGVRKFYALNDRNEVLGYVFFTPLYRDGDVFGYYNDVGAAVKAAPTGLATYITLEALQTFQKEGLESLNLGLSPLCNLAQVENMPRHSLQVWGILKIFYETANYLYNFKGAHEHKRRYRGEDYPVFIATSWHIRLLELSLMSYYIGIIQIRNFPGIKHLHDLWRRYGSTAQR